MVLVSAELAQYNEPSQVEKIKPYINHLLVDFLRDDLVIPKVNHVLKVAETHLMTNTTNEKHNKGFIFNFLNTISTPFPSPHY